jgi:ssDNA-binding Zn-finger/Zn-ribbon topoisomerase 1
VIGDPVQAPRCPRCGANMVERFRHRDGNLFWGCPQYPDCRGTYPWNEPGDRESFDPDPRGQDDMDLGQKD